jgi:hypothetical protein
MSIPIKGLTGAALSLGILFFASGAPADEAATGAMIEHVLNILDGAQRTLAKDNLSRADKERAVNQIRGAMDILVRFRDRRH